jgi:hypothetical protein
MSPKIVITGPEDRLTITPPKSPTPRIATSHLDEAEGGVVILAVNGVVRRLEAYEEISVTDDIAALLENCGYELEYVAEEEPQV